MNPPSDQDAPFVAAAFLRQVADDQEQGSAHSLAHYQARFPGWEELIAGEYARLTGNVPIADTAASDPETPSGFGLIAPADGFVTDGDPGRIGPYRLRRELGRGGQAVVFLAEDTRLGRSVALKVVAQFTPDAPDQLGRFEREALVASRLNHPGICKVFECGFHGGRAYIAMEYVEGETLARRVSAQASTLQDSSSDRDTAAPMGAVDAPRNLPGRTEIKALLRMIEQTARALHAAHQADVIHRDVKPGNIMISEGDRPVILDFGLARAVEGDVRTLTRTGDFFGTPYYMAPEQLTASSERPDHRLDIWGLGVCLHECLTLRRPFEEPTRERLYHAILSRTPPRARTLNRAISRDVEVIVETALQKAPDNRYQSAAAFADDLAAARAGRPIAARPVSWPARVWRWARRRPAAAALLVVLVLGLPTLAGLGGFVIANLPRWEEQRTREARLAHEKRMAEALHRLLQWDFPGAIQAFRDGLRRNPDSLEARGGLALVYLRHRRPEEALGVLAADGGTNVATHALGRIRADALEDLGRAEEATAQRDRLVPPVSATDHFLLGLRTLIRADVDRRVTPGEAYDHFTLADELHAHEPRVIYYFARVTAALGDGDHRHVVVARRVAEVMARRWPDHHLTWYARGIAERDDRAAVEHLFRCLALRPDFTGAYAHLSYRFVTFDAAKALAYADRALARAPGWPWAYAVKARALRMAKRFDEALVEIDKGIDLNPRDPILRIQRGRIEVSRRDFVAAERVFREAIELNPEFSGSHSWLGYTLTAARRFDEAIAAHERAVALAPGRPWPMVQLGRTLHVKGELEGAIDAYTRATRLDPTYARAWFMRGRARQRSGDVVRARADFVKVLELQPDHASANAELARLQE